MKRRVRLEPDPDLDYRAYPVEQVSVLELDGWSRCTPEEAHSYWLMGLDETLEAAGLVGLKRSKR